MSRILIIIAVLPALVLLGFIYMRDRKEKPPVKLMVLLLALGAGTIIPAAIAEFIGQLIVAQTDTDHQTMLLVLCFLLSAVVQLYFKASAANFVLLALEASLLVLSLDWLFFYYMPGYSGAVERYLWFVLPTAVLTIPVCALVFGCVRRIHAEFKIDNGIV